MTAAANSPRLDELSRDELLERLETLGEGGIHIDFSGKTNARKLSRLVRPRVARIVKKYSAGPESAQARNLLIEGDNLQAMATLFRERGQVDLILTDPPYNTGNDWRYNDKWEDDPNDSGVGEWVSADDGSRHTKWMRFMWPRLAMMKSMLKPSGVLAICIDHRELFRLGQMLDELFGEKNRLAIINWQKSYAPKSDSSHISTATEYVLIYAKSEQTAHTQRLPRTEAMDALYGNPDGDARIWASDNATAASASSHQGMVYGIQSPFTGKIHYPPVGRCWGSDKKRMLEWLSGWGTAYVERDLDDDVRRASIIGCMPAEVRKAKGLVSSEDLRASSKRAKTILQRGPWPRLFFTKQGEGGPRLKRYLEDLKLGRIATTYWSDESFFPELELGAVSWGHSESGHNQTGLRELDGIVGKGHSFETVKPLKLFQKIIQLWCPPDGLVMDPFAGSGTTGHAILALNAHTRGSARFILMEQGRPERGDPYASSLTADRLQRVANGDWKSGQRPGLDGGFRFATLGKKVDAQALLSMEREELTDTIIGSHFDADQRRRESLVTFAANPKYRYLVAHNANDEGFFLIWNGSKGKADFDEDVYEACAAEAKRAGLAPRYHVYARLCLYQTNNVDFNQIPDKILTDFGLDIKGEPYYEDPS